MESKPASVLKALRAEIIAGSLARGTRLKEDAIAERFGVSASTLARRFRSETGTTVAGYVAARRAERAARLLTTTSQSVRDIALFVGYDDANYFVKVFRAAYGMTPTAYRASSNAE